MGWRQCLGLGCKHTERDPHCRILLAHSPASNLTKPLWGPVLQVPPDTASWDARRKALFSGLCFPVRNRLGSPPPFNVFSFEIYLFYVYGMPAHQERASDPIIDSYEWLWGCWKNSQCSKPLSHLPSPYFFFFFAIIENKRPLMAFIQMSAWFPKPQKAL